jgi:hypothetical protein
MLLNIKINSNKTSIYKVEDNQLENKQFEENDESKDKNPSSFSIRCGLMVTTFFNQKNGIYESVTKADL